MSGSTRKSSIAPRGRRPRFPKAYGVDPTTKDLLPWAHVDERMTQAKHYWLSTMSAHGAPHARPVDGIWLDGKLYFGGSPETRWRENVQSNPQVCVHLESGTDVVILHGKVEIHMPDEAFAKRLADAAKAKYGDSVPADVYAKGVHALAARRVYAWTDLPRDATRWDLGAEPRKDASS